MMALENVFRKCISTTRRVQGGGGVEAETGQSATPQTKYRECKREHPQFALARH